MVHLLLGLTRVHVRTLVLGTIPIHHLPIMVRSADVWRVQMAKNTQVIPRLRHLIRVRMCAIITMLWKMAYANSKINLPSPQHQMQHNYCLIYRLWVCFMLIAVPTVC